MKPSQKLGFLLSALGASLISIYALPNAYGVAMSHFAVAQFRAKSPANRLWDSARIRAYRQSLDISFAPSEAILRIPRIRIEVPILEGTSEAALNRGVGHIPGTALPGQPGNLAVAGHRDGFFRGLKDLAAGDRIDVERPSRQIDHYIVSAIRIVAPNDTSVLRPTDASTLTLVTCYPFYFVGAAPQRYIVQADLSPSVPTSGSPSSL